MGPGKRRRAVTEEAKHDPTEDQLEKSQDGEYEDRVNSGIFDLGDDEEEEE